MGLRPPTPETQPSGGGPMTAHAEGTFTVASWEEDTYQELAGKEKLTKARMGFQMSGDMAGDLVSDTLMYYREDGTAEYTGVQRFAGQIDGRSGTCVMIADGGFDGGEARSTWRIIPGSGSGDLAGLEGTGASVSASGQPGGTYSLDYKLGWGAGRGTRPCGEPARCPVPGDRRPYGGRDGRGGGEAGVGRRRALGAAALPRPAHRGSAAAGARAHVVGYGTA